MKPLQIFMAAAVVCTLSSLGLVWVTHRAEAAHEAQVEANRRLKYEERLAFEKLQRREAEAAEFTQRAKTNMENWKRAFLDDVSVAVCFHGHVFNAKEMKYEISCDVGLEGYAPSLKVVCNQDRCIHKKYNFVPQSPHQPLRDRDREQIMGRGM